MSIDMEVRAAAIEDADLLVDFNQQMARETEGKELDLDVLRHGVAGMLNDGSRGFYLVAETNGAVVGSLMITTEWSDWRNGDYWWIQSVYVAPEHRRKGAFRSLLAEVRQRAKAAENVRGFRLYVEQDNADAQATYKSLGFSKTGYQMLEDLC